MNALPVFNEPTCVAPGAALGHFSQVTLRFCGDWVRGGSSFPGRLVQTYDVFSRGVTICRVSSRSLPFGCSVHLSVTASRRSNPATAFDSGNAHSACSRYFYRSRRESGGLLSTSHLELPSGSSAYMPDFRRPASQGLNSH